MIVGGTIKNMKFNSNTSEYNLEYLSNGNKTIIYINRELRYPDGLNITYSDCSTVIIYSNLRYIEIDGSKCGGQLVKIHIVNSSEIINITNI